MATWRDVRRLALALPGTTEELLHDRSHWSVGDKFFVWDRPLRTSDFEALGPTAPKGPILGVRTADLEMKEAMIASKPSRYFTTPHFDGYPAVLVQLDKIPAKELEGIITDAWLSRAPKKAVDAFMSARGAHPQRRAARKRRKQ